MTTTSAAAATPSLPPSAVPQITPSQTVGPFFGYGLPYEGGPDVVPPWHPDAIRLRGTVYDGEGEPIPDSLVEIWQAGPDGAPVTRAAGALLRSSGDFSGFGRCPVDRAGVFTFSTLKPGGTDGSAPYVTLLVFARGLLKPVATRIYFPDEAAANATDPVLSAIDGDRRGTLIASAEGERAYRFDVHLQGDQETVFFAF